MSPTDERTIGMVAHAAPSAATILSGGTLRLRRALVIYLVYSDRGPFVRHHAANALNVQIIGAIARDRLDHPHRHGASALIGIP